MTFVQVGEEIVYATVRLSDVVAVKTPEEWGISKSAGNNVANGDAHDSKEALSYEGKPNGEVQDVLTKEEASAEGSKDSSTQVRTGNCLDIVTEAKANDTDESLMDLIISKVESVEEAEMEAVGTIAHSIQDGDPLYMEPEVYEAPAPSPDQSFKEGDPVYMGSLLLYATPPTPPKKKVCNKKLIYLMFFYPPTPQ